MLHTIAVENYRSLRDVVVPLSGLDVVTGANGTGKSSLYRALRLLADCAAGRVIGSLAREGGLPSTLWAGPEKISREMRSGEHPIQGTARSHAVNLKLGFASDEFGYLIDLGHPAGGGSAAFGLDPEVKRETVWSGPVLRPATTLADRKNQLVRVRGEDGSWAALDGGMRTSDSMLAELADPVRAPELLWVRELVRSWRFYDQFRTDATAPARVPSVGTRTPVMADDGADLAAALQTILEVGDAHGLAEAVGHAFPGASVEIDTASGRFEVTMRQRGMLRPLRGAELSDGTLRFLLWTAALLTPRPPSLMVLNEPENSLHPELLPALGELIVKAREHSQLIVVTHSEPLVAAIGAGASRIELVKDTGETVIEGLSRFERPHWNWGKR